MSKSGRIRKPPVTSRRRKAMGQHFLSNRAAAARLVELFAPRPGQHVIEIGPGKGALTDHLLDSGARVTAIELDSRLAAMLRGRYTERSGFTLVEGNVLDQSIEEIARPAPARIVANLPYSITGEVLPRLLMAGSCLSDMMLMLQKEVVERIVAPPGGRKYGSLSVLVQYFTRPRIVMRLSPSSFSPPPAVASAVAEFIFRTPRELPASREASYARFVQTLFAHRRRTLLNNLKAAPPIPEAPAADIALANSGIDARRRPETLTRQECLRLYRELAG